MSENETIEIVKNEITNTYAEGKAIAIQGLLDLYQKEKDLNQELQIRYKIENDKYKEEKEKNIKLDEKFKYAVPDEIVDELYISKDKIREKIKELEENVKEFEEYWSKDPRKFKRTKSIDYYKLEALKELLEENNEM